MRNDRLGWLQALGFWIGGVFLACPLFIGVAAASFIGSELYGNLVSGSRSFHAGGFVLIVFLAIPILPTLLTLVLMLPQAPIGGLVLWLRERRSGLLGDWASVLLFHLQVLATFILCLEVAKPSLLGEDSTGELSLGSGTILGCFLIAWLAQGTVLVIATRMARTPPG